MRSISQRDMASENLPLRVYRGITSRSIDLLICEKSRVLFNSLRLQFSISRYKLVIAESSHDCSSFS